MEGATQGSPARMVSPPGDPGDRWTHHGDGGLAFEMAMGFVQVLAGIIATLPGLSVGLAMGFSAILIPQVTIHLLILAANGKSQSETEKPRSCSQMQSAQ